MKNLLNLSMIQRLELISMFFCNSLLLNVLKYYFLVLKGRELYFMGVLSSSFIICFIFLFGKGFFLLLEGKGSKNVEKCKELSFITRV